MTTKTTDKMKNKNTINIINIITIILLLGMTAGFYMVGDNIHKHGKPITDFCKAHYNNETFMSTMIGDEPAEPIQCQSSQWRTQWRTGKYFQYCNETCFESYDECLEINATKEQVYFMRRCHWMGSDYLAGTVLFKVGFPLAFLAMIISIINKYDKDRRGEYK